MKKLYAKTPTMDWFKEVCAALGIKTIDLGEAWGIYFANEQEAVEAWEIYKEEYRRIFALMDDAGLFDGKTPIEFWFCQGKLGN